MIEKRILKFEYESCLKQVETQCSSSKIIIHTHQTYIQLLSLLVFWLPPIFYFFYFSLSAVSNGSLKKNLHLVKKMGV
jgi:hypothetical protein